MTTPQPPAEDALPDFARFDPGGAEAAIAALLARCEQALEAVTAPGMPADYDRIVEQLAVPLEALNQAWRTLTHLRDVNGTPELRQAVKAVQGRITAFFAVLRSDERLFRLYRRVEAEGAARLDAARRKELADTLRDFRLSGAALDAAGKARFVEISQRLAELSREFADHVLDATDSYAYAATQAELDGVPDDAQARWAAAAQSAGREGSYVVGLDAPALAAVMPFARNRTLRAMLYRAHATRASELDTPGRDNGPLIAEIVALRHERAALLGLPSFAQLSLTSKMAESPQQVLAFLRDLASRARAPAEAELQALQRFGRERLGLPCIEAWDLAFVSEALRRERFSFSDEEIRPHFRLPDVMAGMLRIAEQLFGVRFRPAAAAGWHPDTAVHRVERDGELLGTLFVDPFARKGKRGGAWVNGARPRWRRPGGNLRTAVAYLVTNVAPPAPGQPALLRHADVITLFHEFGHALHFLLSDVEVLGVSGFDGVEWDAVELPSQLMENFGWEWQFVRQITTDPSTGRHLPRELFDKLLDARQFNAGLDLLRQVELALFDMRLHAEHGAARDALALIDEVRSEVAVVRPPTFNRSPHAFSHAFAGGYAAGYYSYLWAEVLAADAWDVFRQAGVTDRATGRRYFDAILSRGGSRPMSESFVAFRGRPPTIDALLRQRGLAAAG